MTVETKAQDLVTKPAPLERHNPTLAELVAAQGINGPQDFDALCGAGADLWDNDADFEAFQAALSQARRIGD